MIDGDIHTSISLPPCNPPVGFLYISRTNDIINLPFKCPTKNLSYSTDSVPLYLNDNFIIGRHPMFCRRVILDTTISNCHLKIYCVGFENNNDRQSLPVLVYAEDISMNGTIIETFSYDDSNKRLIKLLRHRPYLLANNDVIYIGSHTMLRFEQLTFAPSLDLNICQKLEIQRIKNDYIITDRCLGFGGNASVWLAFNQYTNTQLACKVISFAEPPVEIPSTTYNPIMNKKLSGSLIVAILRRKQQSREIEILKSLNHPNVIRAEAIFQSAQNMFLITDLYPGGDLHSFVNHHGGSLKDTHAAFFVMQILEGLNYLHELQIMHRDIKLENILLISRDFKSRIVISDFGSANWFTQGRKQSITGTWSYMAPEILGVNCKIKKTGYSELVDAWSVGVITSYMLTGNNPFTEGGFTRSSVDELKAIGWVGLSHHFKLFVVPKLTALAEKFIRSLCCLDEKKRLTIAGARHHPWLTDQNREEGLQICYDRAISDWKTLNHHRHTEIMNIPTETIQLQPSQLINQSSVVDVFPAQATYYTQEQLAMVDQNSFAHIHNTINQDLIHLNTQWNFDEPSVPHPLHVEDLPVVGLTHSSNGQNYYVENYHGENHHGQNYHGQSNFGQNNHGQNYHGQNYHAQQNHRSGLHPIPLQHRCNDNRVTKRYSQKSKQQLQRIPGAFQNQFRHAFLRRPHENTCNRLQINQTQGDGFVDH